MSDKPNPDNGTSAAPAPRRGAPRAANVPRMETVWITAPDLARRAALAKSRSRLVITACGFAALFLAVAGKLAVATILSPLQPHLPAATLPHAPDPADTTQGADGAPGSDTAGGPPRDSVASGLGAHRAMITDRNGEILAVSLPTAGLFANPREMIDQAQVAHRLKQVLPRIDEDAARARLMSEKQFVYLARQITPREELAINRLGIPGVYFEPTERRRYPQGHAAAQLLGGVDVDERGIAGVERYFDDRLRDDARPLRLSLDLRVQSVVHEELETAITTFDAIGGAGVVMDVRTGEVLAMVSLPDYDANEAAAAKPEQRFNRVTTGIYEPGSTFKLQTVSMSLDSGLVNIWNGFDASHPIVFGRFTINDFEGKKRFLMVPEIIAYSSNIGAARMAASVGAERQHAWMEKMGMLGRVPIELPETATPLYPPVANWKEIATMTIAFGHGIAVSPLHVITGTSAIANGGILRHPTLIALDPDAAPPEGVRVMQQTTSDTVRKLMRLVVTDGFGKNAEVPGYYVGGKTGTAEKIAHHGYNHNSRVSAFICAYPMQAPRYAVYMMLDEPHAIASTHGYATAGWVIAPSVGKVIARIGPMLGVLPDLEHTAEINQALYIPLQPGKAQPGKAGTARLQADKGKPAAAKPATGTNPTGANATASVPSALSPTRHPPLPASNPPPAPAHAADVNHQAALQVPATDLPREHAER